YEDRSGVLWVGTQANGINKVHLKRRFFTHYKHLPEIENSLSSSMILALAEDAKGSLWIGTYQGGLNRLDRRTGVIEPYFFDPNDRYSISNNTINTILTDHDGEPWYGTAEGLNQYDPVNNRFNRYNGKLTSEFITALAEDFEGDLWVGTNNGLNRINDQDTSVVRYFNNSNDSTSISSNTITTILVDRVGNLWIGTEDNGLNWYDRGKNEFYQYQHRIEIPNSISDNRILSLFVDSQDRFWVGTRRGLNLLKRESGDFTHYDVRDGLPGSVINGILEDRRGNLWLSSNNGIARFNPNTLSIKDYDTQDGVQDREFNPNASHMNAKGEMVFGGVNGFNLFDPETIRDNAYLPPVVLTALTQNGLDLEPGRTKETIQKVTLTWPVNSFEFEFASLNYTQSERNQQAYMLEGLDRDWNYIGEENSGRYTNLSGGKYTLKLKGSNNDGLWNPAETIIEVIVIPPFWQRWWFRIGVLLFITGLLSFSYRQRIYRIEKRRKRLELRVEEKAEAAQALQEALSEVELLKNRLQAENIYLRDEIKVQHNFANIITNSRKLKKVLQSVEQVAATDSTVLVLGESGTGKELLARAVHNVSARSDRPLVKVDCSTLPANLIESELFGHEKGAFTGAVARKIGRFELADKGTIFLDEIGDLPLELQTKLLRVLQDNEFERLGNPKTIKVDVRVIAATNRDLDKAIEEHQFREDLYYRLNVFPIEIPPLRERKGDVELLVNHFVSKYSKKVGKTITSITQRVMDTLTSYQWPGNVRELENIIERAVIISSPDNFTLGNWPPKSELHTHLNTGPLVTLEEMEINYIIQILDQTGWRVSGAKGAAQILGMNPKTLESRMSKLDIKRKK
ncbi:sigma 54-interacting transcriptional regulator, partial [Candidatus Neomarinimicrobiota bacterium]